MKTAVFISGAAALVFALGSVLASSMYDVDEDHDGRADRTLMLEQSDSLA